MFEEEAEIYTEEYYYETPKQFFLAGAKVGYNKAKEWHMTEKEDLPEITDKNRTVLYLAWTSYGIGGSPAIIRPLRKKYMNLWTGAILDKKDIVAWKECDLPYF